MKRTNPRLPASGGGGGSGSSNYSYSSNAASAASTSAASAALNGGGSGGGADFQKKRKRSPLKAHPIESASAAAAAGGGRSSAAGGSSPSPAAAMMTAAYSNNNSGAGGGGGGGGKQNPMTSGGHWAGAGRPLFVSGSGFSSHAASGTSTPVLVKPNYASAAGGGGGGGTGSAPSTAGGGGGGGGGGSGGGHQLTSIVAAKLRAQQSLLNAAAAASGAGVNSRLYSSPLAGGGGGGSGAPLHSRASPHTAHRALVVGSTKSPNHISAAISGAIPIRAGVNTGTEPDDARARKQQRIIQQQQQQQQQHRQTTGGGSGAGGKKVAVPPPRCPSDPSDVRKQALSSGGSAAARVGRGGGSGGTIGMNTHSGGAGSGGGGSGGNGNGFGPRTQSASSNSSNSSATNSVPSSPQVSGHTATTTASNSGSASTATTKATKEMSPPLSLPRVPQRFGAAAAGSGGAASLLANGMTSPPGHHPHHPPSSTNAQLGAAGAHVFFTAMQQQSTATTAAASGTNGLSPNTAHPPHAIRSPAAAAVAGAGVGSNGRSPVPLGVAAAGRTQSHSNLLASPHPPAGTASAASPVGGVVPRHTPNSAAAAAAVTTSASTTLSSRTPPTSAGVGRSLLASGAAAPNASSIAGAAIAAPPFVRAGTAPNKPLFGGTAPALMLTASNSGIGASGSGAGGGGTGSGRPSLSAMSNVPLVPTPAAPVPLAVTRPSLSVLAPLTLNPLTINATASATASAGLSSHPSQPSQPPQVASSGAALTTTATAAAAAVAASAPAPSPRLSLSLHSAVATASAAAAASTPAQNFTPREHHHHRSASASGAAAMADNTTAAPHTPNPPNSGGGHSHLHAPSSLLPGFSSVSGGVAPPLHLNTRLLSASSSPSTPQLIAISAGTPPGHHTSGSQHYHNTPPGSSFIRPFGTLKVSIPDTAASGAIVPLNKTPTSGAIMTILSPSAATPHGAGVHQVSTPILGAHHMSTGSIAGGGGGTVNPLLVAHVMQTPPGSSHARMESDDFGTGGVGMGSVVDEQLPHNQYTYAISIRKGRRKKMQDSYAAVPSLYANNSPAVSVFGVFDGHGRQGHNIAQLASRHLVQHVLSVYHTPPATSNPANATAGAGTGAAAAAAAAVASSSTAVTAAITAAASAGSSAAAMADDKSSAGASDTKTAPVAPTAPAAPTHSFASSRSLWEKDVNAAFTHVFSAIDDACMNAFEDGGSTAVCCYIRWSDQTFHVAHVGDSRAVLSRGRRAIILTNDHKPERADERARIEAAGGRVVFVRGWRVEGTLAVARSIGDKSLKRFVIGTPEVTSHKLTGTEEVLIMATDGVWGVLEPQEAVDLALTCNGAGDAAELLISTALSRPACNDNLTVLVIYLSPSKLGAAHVAAAQRAAHRPGSSSGNPIPFDRQSSTAGSRRGSTRSGGAVHRDSLGGAGAAGAAGAFALTSTSEDGDIPIISHIPSPQLAPRRFSRNTEQPPGGVTILSPMLEPPDQPLDTALSPAPLSIAGNSTAAAAAAAATVLSSPNAAASPVLHPHSHAHHLSSGGGGGSGNASPVNHQPRTLSNKSKIRTAAIHAHAPAHRPHAPNAPIASLLSTAAVSSPPLSATPTAAAARTAAAAAAASATGDADVFMSPSSAAKSGATFAFPRPPTLNVAAPAATSSTRSMKDY